MTSCIRNGRWPRDGLPRYTRGARIPRRANGFTIIELMVVVAVITILALLAGPNLMGALRRAKLSGEGRRLFAAFNEARGLAISQTTRHQMVFDRGAKRWEIRAEDDDGAFSRVVTVHPRGGDSWPEEINFGPQEGVSNDFASPYNLIDHDAWCTPCGSGNTSGSIIFDTDGRVRDTNGDLVSGWVMLHDPTGSTNGRVEALVFVGATGNARLFTTTE